MSTEEHTIEHICSVCQALFTRKTHLTRHLRSHTNQRTYICTLCNRATFTRNDLLTRHVKRCALKPGGVPPSRRKACRLCIQRKVKCDLQQPCAKCAARGTECSYASIREPESVAGPSTLPGRSRDLSGSRRPRPGADSRSPRPSEGRPVSTADGLAEQSLVPWDARQAPFIDETMAVTFPLFGSSDPHPEFPPFSFPPSNPNTYPSPPQESDLSSVSHAGSSMGSEMIFDSSLLNDAPRPGPGSVPLETVLEINASFFDDFLNQACTPGFLNQVYTPTFQRLDSLLHPSNFLPVLGSPDAVDNSVPDLDSYLAHFFSVHCRAYPFVHLPTWNESSATPLLVRAMQASGALYMTHKGGQRAADKFILEALQSNLRQEIFRTFIDTPVEDIDTQTSLVLALASVQNLGLFHRSHAERSASTGYHGMLVTMIRKSSLSAALESWNLDEIDASNSPQAWASWARYEAMKRVLLLVYLHDTLMPVFHNLPSCLDENELPLRLPCDEALWEAPDASSWSILATVDPAALRGAPLHTQLTRLLSPRADVPPAPLNRFACFVTIHALLRAAVLERGAQIPLQRALGKWYVCWLAGGGGHIQAGEQPNFTSIALPLYWLAELMAQVDGADPVSRQGHVRYTTVKRWLKEFWGLLRATGDIGSGSISGSDHAETSNGYVQEMATPETTNGSEAEDDGLLEWIPR